LLVDKNEYDVLILNCKYISAQMPGVICITFGFVLETLLPSEIKSWGQMLLITKVRAN